MESVASSSAAPAARVTGQSLPLSSARNEQIDRVRAAIAMVADHRAANRPRMELAPSLLARGLASANTPPLMTENVTPITTAIGAVSAEPAQESPTVADDVAIFDGDDNTCTLCLSDLHDGERVCRIRCGHVFHTNCWDQFLNTVNTPPRPGEHRLLHRCPNCRGAGTIIAIWRYIDGSRTTQMHTNGNMVPNELEATASAHAISTPRVTPPSQASSGSGNFEHARSPPRPRSPHSGLFTLKVGEDRLVEPSGDPEEQMCRPCFRIQTRLADGRPSLVVDPGSVGNLCGDAWAKTVAVAAAKNGQKPSYTKRGRPLRVQGVGNGTQSCAYDCTLPVALKRKSGSSVAMGQIVTPTVSGSELPGLLGLSALRNNRAVLDFQTLELHFCGPGDYDLAKGMPAGTDTFQLELAPSGHMVLPCCEYTPGTTAAEHTLTLMTRTKVVPPAPAHPPRNLPAASSSSTPPPPPPPGLTLA